ncbi:MAG TPA: cytochrome b562 [Opitutaceae bacterium]|nr:cytochrome b562 [Opitutaceae bacterium]
MRSIHSALFFSLILATAPLGFSADSSSTVVPNKAPVKGPEAAAKDRDATELGDKMDEVGDAFKKLRKQISDASKNASSLELIAVMRKNAEASLNLQPAKTEDVPEADRAKFIADYKKGIHELITKLDALSASLKANDNAAAEKQLKELGSFQRESHKHFRRPKD